MALALYPAPKIHKELIIDGQKIRQDAEGRYFLNDVLKISGLGKHKAPGNWIRTEIARDLAAEISQDANMRLGNNEPFKIVHGGINAGTYACREMVIAYSCWLNARFHLAVIRAFDEMMAGQTAQEKPRYRVPSGRIFEGKPKKIKSRGLSSIFREIKKVGQECGLSEFEAMKKAASFCEGQYGFNPISALGLQGEKQ